MGGKSGFPAWLIDLPNVAPAAHLARGVLAGNRRGMCGGSRGNGKASSPDLTFLPSSLAISRCRHGGRNGQL